MGGWTIYMNLLLVLAMLVGALSEPTSMEWQMESAKAGAGEVSARCARRSCPTPCVPQRFVEARVDSAAAMEQCGCVTCPCVTTCGCVSCPCSEWKLARVEQRNNGVMDIAGRMNPPRPGKPLKKASVIDGRKPCPAGNCDVVEATYGAINPANHKATPAAVGKPDPVRCPPGFVRTEQLLLVATDHAVGSRRGCC